MSAFCFRGRWHCLGLPTCTWGRDLFLADLYPAHAFVQANNATSSEKSGAIVQYTVIPTVLSVFVLLIWYVTMWRPFLNNTPGADIESYFAAKFQCFAAAGEDGGGKSKVSSLLIASAVKKMRILATARQKMGGVFKVLTGFLQVTSSFVDTFEIEWPSFFMEFTRIASLLQLDIMTLPAAVCSFSNNNYFERLLTQMLMPPCVILLLAIPSIIVAALGLAKHGGMWNHPASNPTFERFFQALVLFLFIIYPAISKGILTSFNTMNYGPDGRYLKADHTGE